MEGLEKERDFYFGKLRDIEVLCQEQEDVPVVGKILEILYATEVSLLHLQHVHQSPRKRSGKSRVVRLTLLYSICMHIVLPYSSNVRCYRCIHTNTFLSFEL